MSVKPLRLRFIVLPKMLKNMALGTDVSDMKKTSVSYPVF